MDRVAEMKFCPPEHPPPEPSFERAQDPESRARDRFSLVGKCAIGKPIQLHATEKPLQ